MHPREVAAISPEKPAIIVVPSGQTVTYGELTLDDVADLTD